MRRIAGIAELHAAVDDAICSVNPASLCAVNLANLDAAPTSRTGCGLLSLIEVHLLALGGQCAIIATPRLSSPSSSGWSISSLRGAPIERMTVVEISLPAGFKQTLQRLIQWGRRVFVLIRRPLPATSNCPASNRTMTDPGKTGRHRAGFLCAVQRTWLRSPEMTPVEP
ncbi:hypothetical protein [Bradyrhizobium sp.]|uniref:hypothetical protein n=1 Tax=Bradyrhizobium sp. TaxID=376 RepID=UPI0040379C01